MRPLDAARMGHLGSLGLSLENKAVLEPGCGHGLLTEFWESRGCKVTSTDGRPGNVAKNIACYPHRKVEVVDLRKPGSHKGVFDVVFLYGTLYHVDDPAQVISDLAKNCGELFLLETCVWKCDDGEIHPHRENPAKHGQAIGGLGCRPARDWVMRELKKHFAHVYVTCAQPSHFDFPTRWPAEQSPRGLYRAVFVASRKQLLLPTLMTELPQEQEMYHGT